MGSGIINGGAFGFVVKSLVDNIIIPPIAGLFKQPDFSRLYYALAAVAPKGGLEKTQEMGAVNRLRSLHQHRDQPSYNRGLALYRD
jgi:large conductance mechanosensitive channel